MLKIQFVKPVEDKETGAIKSYLYFVISDDAGALETYQSIKGYEPNQVSGLYPYFSSKFIGNNSTIEHVHTDKYNDFYPAREAKAFLKAQQDIRQRACIIHKNVEAQNSYVEKEITKLIASTGNSFSWKSVAKQEETPAEETTTGMDNL